MYSNLYLIYYKFPKTFKKILKYLKFTNLIKFILSLIKYNFKNQVKIKCLFDIKFSIKNDPYYEIRLSYLPLLIDGKFEKPLIEILKTNLVKSDTVIDCGCSFGIFSLLSSKLVGEKGRVYSFDVSQISCQNLEENKKLNFLNNIEIVNKALSEKNEKSRIYGEKSISGYSIIKNFYEDVFFEVDAITLDDFFLKKNISNIKLIKLDIEGAEYFALRGMKKLIQKNPNAIVVIEIFSFFLDKLKIGINDLIDTFDELNLNVFYDITNNKNHISQKSESKASITKISVENLRNYQKISKIGKQDSGGKFLQLLAMNKKKEKEFIKNCAKKIELLHL